jgi:peptide/nickel transport system permease protein
MNQSEVEIPLKAELVTLDAEGLAPQETPWEEFLRIFTKDYQALFGFWVLVFLLLMALAGKALTEWWVMFDPEVVRLTDKFLPPLSVPSPDSIPTDRPFGGVYLMGTDELGRDVFARMFQGSFVSLSIGFVAVGISLGIGILLGGLSGFYGHVKLWFITVDTLIMRFTDAMMCFPTFFLILTAVALLPPSIYTIMIIIGLFSWMGTARFVRAEFLSIREQDFVTAAKALGIPEGRIIFRHMVPNALAPVFVSATIGVASAILTESGLSFLGFGVPPPYATWGNILSDGKGFVFDAPWLFFIPGLAIFMVVLAFNLVGEGLREALNPKLRSR